MGVRVGLAIICVLAAACASADRRGEATTTTAAAAPTSYVYPDPPAVDDDPTPRATAAFDGIVAELLVGEFAASGLDDFVAAGDARHAWLVSDLMRFTADADVLDRLVAAFVDLTGVDPSTDPDFAQSPWKSVTDHLITWDLPAPPDYRDSKARLFLAVEPRWAPFFADADAAIDWRWLSWGGVLIDDRPLGDTEPCPPRLHPRPRRPSAHRRRRRGLVPRRHPR